MKYGLIAIATVFGGGATAIIVKWWAIAMGLIPPISGTETMIGVALVGLVGVSMLPVGFTLLDLNTKGKSK